MSEEDRVKGAVEYALSLDWPGTVCVIDGGEVYVVGTDQQRVWLGFAHDVAEMTIGEVQQKMQSFHDDKVRDELAAWLRVQRGTDEQ